MLASSNVHVTLSEPLIVTAVVALAAAIVGGAVTYFANRSAERRHQEGLAKIRRSRKTYRPLRSELTQLRGAMRFDQHLAPGGITLSDSSSIFTSRVRLVLWREIVADGRAGIAVSRDIRKLLEAVNESALRFNEEVDSTFAAVKSRGETMASEMDFATGVGNWFVHDYAPLVRMQLDGNLEIIDGPGFGDRQPSPRHAEFADAWREDTVAQRLHERVTKIDAELRERVDAAIEALDEAITTIATKYERETSKD
jgi:hypothetical protein